MAIFIDPQTGLQYRQEATSADFSGVSLRANDPFLPDEVVNKRTQDLEIAGLETKCREMVAAIKTGITTDEVASLLQPIKDSLEALKQNDDRALIDRLNNLDQLVNRLIKAGVGTGTVIQQGATLRYYNLGLQEISYQDVPIGPRKIVITTVAVNLRTTADATPIALRRIAKGRHQESLPLPQMETIDDRLYIYFQGSDQTPVGDYQIVVAIEPDNITNPGDMPLPVEVLASLDSTLPETVPQTDIHELKLPNGNVKLNAQGAVIWTINDTAEFTSGVQMKEIFQTGDALYGSNGKNHSVTPSSNPSWQKVDNTTYQAARDQATEIATPPAEDLNLAQTTPESPPQ